MAESDSDDEDYVFLGTALREEESTFGRRPVTTTGHQAKDPQQQGMSSVKTLPLWQQEAVDDQGRRRFHGAFTGGFSAGYFNTVGSKEGFEPATFRSSRSDRFAASKQSVQDFLDTDELEEMAKTKIETQSQYDTFGFRAAAKAQQALPDEIDIPQIIPGPLIQELTTFSSDSWGVKMLQLMGWRQGRGIGLSRAHAGSGESRWGTLVGVGVDNTPVFKLAAKRNRYGMGFDPYKGAEEFRSLKRGNEHDDSGLKRKKRRGVAFGTGVLEEFDTYGEEDDYVTELVETKHTGFQEVMSEDEDDLHAFRRDDGRERLAGSGPAAPMIGTAHDAVANSRSIIRGFAAADSSGLQATHYHPPQVPEGFQDVHRFPPSLPLHSRRADTVEHVKQVTPPDDPAIKHAADTLAGFVAKHGESFEALARKRQAGKSEFSFLQGGEGAEYYAWRVNSLRVASGSGAEGQAPASSQVPPPPRRSAVERMRVLGEEPLPGAAKSDGAPGRKPDADSRLQNSIRPSRTVQNAIAPGDKQMLISALEGKFVSAAKQEMQERHQADGRPEDQISGLRFSSSGTIQQPLVLSGGLVTKSEISSALGGHAGSSDQGSNRSKLPPVRSVLDWWPESLLCKRFGVPDPNKGKDRPAGPTGSRFLTDHLTLPETNSMAEASEPEAAFHQAPAASQNALQDAPPQTASAAGAAEMADVFLQSLFQPKEADVQNEAGADDSNQLQPSQSIEESVRPDTPANKEVSGPTAQQQLVVSKPIDIFKAVFEDSSSEEDEEPETVPRQKEMRPSPPTSRPEEKHIPKPNSLGSALLQASFRDEDRQQQSQMTGAGAGMSLAPTKRNAAICMERQLALAPEPRVYPQPQTQKDAEVLQILDALRSVKKKKRVDEPKHKHKHKHKHSKSKKRSSEKGGNKKRGHSKHGSKGRSSKSKKDRHRHSASPKDSSSEPSSSA